MLGMLHSADTSIVPAAVIVYLLLVQLSRGIYRASGAEP